MTEKHGDSQEPLPIDVPTEEIFNGKYINAIRDEDERFAHNVKFFRERKGWSQADLANRMRWAGASNFHPTTVSRIENGDRRVTLSEAALAARILQLPFSRMILKNSTPLDIFEREVGEYEGRVAQVMSRLDEADAERQELLGRVEAIRASVNQMAWPDDASKEEGIREFERLASYLAHRAQVKFSKAEHLDG